MPEIAPQEKSRNDTTRETTPHANVHTHLFSKLKLSVSYFISIGMGGSFNKLLTASFIRFAMYELFIV